jgi:branched-chain amino acid transport system substrate-binding protein
MQVRTLGAYLFQDLGIKKVAILYPDEKYGKKYMELFWDIVDEYEGQVVGVESYDGTKNRFYRTHTETDR